MKNAINTKALRLKIIVLTITAFFCFASVWVASPVFAKSEGELQTELDDVNSKLGTAKSEYQKAKEELDSLNSQIATLQTQIATAEAEIAAMEAEIVIYDEQLRQLAQDIIALEGEVSNQNSDLNQRLRVMYQTDNGSLLMVLLGSESVVDFLSNLEMVQRIYESDKNFLDTLQAKLNLLEIKKVEVTQIEESLTVQKTTIEAHKAALDQDKAALGVASARAQEIRDAAYEDLVALEKESKRIEQELAARHSDLTFGGGPLSWPCYGPVTSEYGMRVNPVHGAYVLHGGIDLGVATGTPIRAAADGIVIFAAWSGGYGNFVMVDHGTMEDGRTLVTCYGHNSGFAASKGQSVLKGDVIAYAGSTGNSTGPHCHFEVRVNGTPQNPRGWL